MVKFSKLVVRYADFEMNTKDFVENELKEIKFNYYGVREDDPDFENQYDFFGKDLVSGNGYLVHLFSLPADLFSEKSLSDIIYFDITQENKDYIISVLDKHF